MRGSVSGTVFLVLMGIVPHFGGSVFLGLSRGKWGGELRKDFRFWAKDFRFFSGKCDMVEADQPEAVRKWHYTRPKRWVMPWDCR